jgi:chemotaxis protein MotB
MSIARRARRTETNIWPAFVDAQGQLLIAIIFVLLVLSVFQFVTTDVLSGKDETLARLTKQLNELNQMLGLERSANADLRSNASQLASELQAANAAKDQLTTRVAELAAKSQEDAARADRLSSQVADLTKTATVDKAAVEMQLRELESLRRDIVALRQVRQDLEAKVGDLAAAQQKSEADLTAARDRSKELEARLSTEAERTALAQKDIKDRDVKLAEQQKIASDAQTQVAMLSQQIASLRDQLQRISAALDLTEGKNKEQQVQLADLSKRLNLALASKVEELSRYRSEFFGKLREVLGDRQDVQIVGDRFVFQAEVLFPPGSADLGENAAKLEPIATALKEIAPKIPKDLHWVLRVDGHTDPRPINTPQFPSNWYLSTSRAIAVVNQLVQMGVPPEHLAATGFGEFQPIDPRNDEVGWRRDRRIELKLTER